MFFSSRFSATSFSVSFDISVSRRFCIVRQSCAYQCLNVPLAIGALLTYDLQLPVVVLVAKLARVQVQLALHRVELRRQRDVLLV